MKVHRRIRVGTPNGVYQIADREVKGAKNAHH